MNNLTSNLLSKARLTGRAGRGAQRVKNNLLKISARQRFCSLSLARPCRYGQGEGLG